MLIAKKSNSSLVNTLLLSSKIISIFSTFSKTLIRNIKIPGI